jgi:hypothetical protein
MRYLDQIKADIQRKFELARKMEQPPVKQVSEAEQNAQTEKYAHELIQAALRKAAGR